MVAPEKYKDISARACGHTLSLELTKDGKHANLTVDGFAAGTKAVSLALGIPVEMCEHFMCLYGRCEGDPLCCTQELETVKLAQIQMLCMAGYANAVQRQRQKHKI